MSLPLNPPAQLAKTCPYCGQALDGTVFATFVCHQPEAVVQIKRVGTRLYTWSHHAGGCHCPNLDRPDAVKAACQGGLVHNRRDEKPAA